MADFQEHNAALERLDTQVVAISADTLEQARGTVQELGLEYMVLYGVDAEAVSSAIGCYTGTRNGHEHVQPATFVLDGGGRVAYATYSSGKVGRLTAADAITVVKGLRS